MPYPTITLTLPNWVDTFLADSKKTVYPTVEERMQLVIQLSKLNIEHETGGPFGAAIFNLETHELLAPGVNLVPATNCAIFHAEMVAIALAQKLLDTFDLGAEGLPAYALVASTEPCAMCFGATPWSGVRQLVCGARDADARAIGFDEGPKLPDWVTALEERGIQVIKDVLRTEAQTVLQTYAQNSGLIYNARQS